MSKIKETRELIAGIAAIGLRTFAGLKDGKLSTLEKLGYIGDIREVMAAIDGITDIPKELLDISDEDYRVVENDVRAALLKAGFKHRTGDLTAKIMRWVRFTVVTIVDIIAMPPAALPVE